MRLWLIERHGKEKWVIVHNYYFTLWLYYCVLLYVVHLFWFTFLIVKYNPYYNHSTSPLAFCSQQNKRSLHFLMFQIQCLFPALYDWILKSISPHYTSARDTHFNIPKAKNKDCIRSILMCLSLYQDLSNCNVLHSEMCCTCNIFSFLMCLNSLFVFCCIFMSKY